MKIDVFIKNLKEAFGDAIELPITFWYSDEKIADTDKINGCFFKEIASVRQGGLMSLSVETIGCGGGKFYTGFTDMPVFVPNFVSIKERYKETPEMVIDFIEHLGVEKMDKKYLNFARIDKVDSFDNLEGIVFFATPDILSGLATWTFFDNNAEDAITTMFASGCSAVVTQVVNENRVNGSRTFIGFFDPSARPHVEADVLSFAIPMSLLNVMYHTMRKSSLFDTHAWVKIRERINANK